MAKFRFFASEGSTEAPAVKQGAAARRAAKMATADLLDWANTTILVTGQAFDAYRYHEQPIEEVIVCLDALSAILNELQQRNRSAS